MKRTIAFIFIMCIILNLFSGVSSVGHVSDEAVSQPDSIGSPLFDVVASVKAPFSKVNSLLVSVIPLFPEFKTPFRGKDTNSSSEALCLLQAGSASLKNLNTNIKSIENTSIISAGSALLELNLRDKEHSPPGIWFIYLLLLAHFVLLSKIDLPWELKKSFA